MSKKSIQKIDLVNVTPCIFLINQERLETVTVGVTLAFDDHNRLQAHKMVLTSKTRLGKRKLEIKEVRKEKQVVASKKHDNKCFTATETSTKNDISATRKPQTKADLIDQMDLMKQLNDALLEEVKSNEEAIAILEGKRRSIWTH